MCVCVCVLCVCLSERAGMYLLDVYMCTRAHAYVCVCVRVCDVM